MTTRQLHSTGIFFGSYDVSALSTLQPRRKHNYFDEKSCLNILLNYF